MKRCLCLTLVGYSLFAFAQPEGAPLSISELRRRPGFRKQLEQEFNLAKKKAEQGDPVAQWHLGMFYQGGSVTPKSETNAVYWFTKSAESGFIPAQCELAPRFETGQGVPQDFARARRLYQPSASQDNRQAQYRLGYLYLAGLGGPKDAEKGIEWLTRSAELNSAEAQQELGKCYREGLGVPKNAVVASSWTRKAALQGNLKAQNELGDCCFRGIGTPKDYVEAYKWINLSLASEDDRQAREELSELEALMTREQIAEAQKLCREFVPVVLTVPPWANHVTTNLFEQPRPK